MRTNQLTRPGKHGLLMKLSSVPLAMLICGSVYAVPAPPANDECVNANVILSSAPPDPYTDTVDGTSATSNGSDPQLSCNSNDGGQTVWWEYTPDTTGNVNITTAGSLTSGGGELDTAHGAFTGSCGSLTQVACVDSGLTDDLNFFVEAGTTYYIKVGQFAGASDAGSYTVSVLEGRPLKEPSRLVIESSFNGTTPPIGPSVAAATPHAMSADRAASIIKNVREIPNYVAADAFAPKPLIGGVKGSAVAGSLKNSWASTPDIMQVIEAGNNTDNGLALGILIAPPDTIGDVGQNHYVQMFNLLTEIYDKDGNSILGPFPTSTFFSGIPASWCAYLDAGDPIVLYDEETDRWMVSQFLDPGFQNGLCIAVSTSGDPTGSWNVYEYDFDDIGFPDYPKFGFATGALSLMVNLFEPYQGSALGVIDKEELLAGDPATMVLFTGGEQELELFTGWIPGDNDGPVFDNFPPTFFSTLGFFDDGDRIFWAEITTNWDSPQHTQLDFGGIPVSPWDQDLCNASREACVPQPGSGTSNIPYLAAINDRLMHRGQVRDFGNKKVAMLNHTVDVNGKGKAGVRWYQMQNKRDEGWKLKKEETFSPDGKSRWMGSIAMTAQGNVCLGYSLSSKKKYTSIAVTGLKGGADQMNVKENVVWNGNKEGKYVQRETVRWGDYSSMNIDPVDDTCWYTQEFASPNPWIGEIFGWGTAIIQYDVN